MTRSAILLSGGIDSTALAYQLQPELGITIDYGQVCAKAEVQAARQIAKELGLAHEVLHVDCRELGAGSMSGQEQLEVATTPEWWPFRNQLLITLAAMETIQREMDELILGSVKDDEEHLDGTEEFFELINEVLSYQEGHLRVSAPAIRNTSEELVHDSNIPRSILGWTHSCHDSNTACGHCRGCKKRHRVLDKVY